jgi:CRP-like cAMP-binding protein
MMTAAPLLTYIEQYTVLEQQEKLLIEEAYQHRIIDKKQILFQQGEHCMVEAFVLSGTLRVFCTDKKGNEHVLYFALPGWWVGDLASFYDGIPAFISVQALEKTELLLIDPDTKAKLFERIPSLERVFRIIIQKNLSSLQQRFLNTMSESADQRYLNLLEKIPTIEQLVPQHQIASYLGILPESLSRLKKQLMDNKR